MDSLWVVGSILGMALLVLLSAYSAYQVQQFTTADKSMHNLK